MCGKFQNWKDIYQYISLMCIICNVVWNAIKCQYGWLYAESDTSPNAIYWKIIRKLERNDMKWQNLSFHVCSSEFRFLFDFLVNGQARGHQQSRVARTDADCFLVLMDKLWTRRFCLLCLCVFCEFATMLTYKLHFFIQSLFKIRISKE